MVSLGQLVIVIWEIKSLGLCEATVSIKNPCYEWLVASFVYWTSWVQQSLYVIHLFEFYCLFGLVVTLMTLISRHWFTANSSFHFKAILGVTLTLFITSLLIWVASNFVSHSLPLLFRCMPCRVKSFLSKLVSTKVTWLCTFATLSICLLKAWISEFIT